MTLIEKIERSKSKELIDFPKIGCANQQVPLARVVPTERIVVEPNWTLDGDFEGGMYADYIAEHPGYDGVYVRSDLLHRLEKAANSLDNQYKLIVRAGHRPLDVQKRLLRECAEEFKNNNPGITDEDALAHARIFVSDPEVELPPHCTAAAVDVDVLDTESGQPVDFGTKVNENNERSYLYTDDISEEQKQNRQMLLEAMLDAGLASCYSEWWHFSYGDQVWAWFYGEQNCLYGTVDL